MSWFYLCIAGLLEIAWAVGLKLSHGLTRPSYAIFTVVAMVCSFVFLALAMKQLPMGTAYAVWTGMGAVGVALLGIVFFGESTSPLRLAGLALIFIGLVCLKLTSAAS